MKRLGLLVVCVIGHAAHADITHDDAVKAATALFEQGRLLVEAGQADAACDKFEASLRLDPKLGTKLNVADCHERHGRLVAAYELFVDAADEAARAKKEGREAFARKRIAALLERLARVTVHVREVPGLVLRLGDRVLPPGAWLVPQVIKPGTIAIDASAPGYRPAHATPAATAGAELVVDLVLEPAGTVTTAVARKPSPAPRPSLMVPAILVGAGGGLWLGSLALGVHARSRWTDAKAAHDLDRVHAAQREADYGTVAFAVGAAFVTAGVIVYLRGRHARGDVVVAPTGDAGSAGLVMAGSF